MEENFPLPRLSSVDLTAIPHMLEAMVNIEAVSRKLAIDDFLKVYREEFDKSTDGGRDRLLKTWRRHL